MDIPAVGQNSNKSSTGSGFAVSGPLAVILACGCLIALLSFGVRSSFGLFTTPVSEAYGWGRDVFAIAMAVQNIMWGVGQPLAGILVDRYGPARVLAAGGALYALGSGLSIYATTPIELYLTAGFMTGLGMGGASYITVLAAFGRLVPEQQRSWALGLGTAAGSLGQFLVVPLTQAVIATWTWQQGLLFIALLVGCIPLLSAALPARVGAGESTHEAAQSVTAALRRAFGHASYVLLVSGFFVCGFQLAFITIHMPAYLTDAGTSVSLGAWAIGIIGLCNIVGAYVAGLLGARRSKKNLLSLIYLGRGLATALFVSLPVTPASVLSFAAAMGLLWLSTAPLTSGLVAVMFGTRYMATLFGLVFLSHQIGSFLGVWLGGMLFERTGSYGIVWWLSVSLSVVAAIVHLPIRERPAFNLALAR